MHVDHLITALCLKSLLVSELIFFIALVKAVCASWTVVQPSHNGAGSCFCVAESQVIYHVGREESSSEE